MDEHLYTLRVVMVAGRKQTNVYGFLEGPDGRELDSRRAETAPTHGSAYAAGLRIVHELEGVAGLLLAL